MAGILDGRKWLEDRVGFLQEELAGCTDDDQRALMQVELATLQEELGRARRGIRRRRLWGLFRAH